MYFFRQKLIISFFLLIVTFSWSSVWDQVIDYQLDNGLRVILLPQLQKQETVAVQVWYKTGSAYEKKGKTGIAHLLEHLMFKGTQKHSGDEYTKTITRFGGNQNAYTSKDRTVFHVNIHSRYLKTVLDLEADRMKNLRFSSNDFQLERNVVMEERRVRIEDQPIASLMEQFYETVYQGDGFGHPVIGYSEDLRGLTREDAMGFYSVYYQPRNAVLIIVGNFDAKAVKKMITRFWGRLKNTNTTLRPYCSIHPAPFKQVFIVQRDVKLPIWISGMMVPNISHHDYVPLLLISELLVGGRSSLFQRDIIDTQHTAVELGGSYNGDEIGPGLFYVYGIPKGKDGLAKIEQSISKELKTIQEQGFSPEDVQKIKNKQKAEFIYALDSNSGMAGYLGNMAIVGKPLNYADTLLQRIQQMDDATLMRVFNEQVNFLNATTGYLQL